MIQKLAKRLLLTLTVVSIGFAVWSYFATVHFECELSSKCLVTLETQPRGLNVIWCNYSGNIDHPRGVSQSLLNSSKCSWFPSINSFQNSGSSGASKYWVSSLAVRLPFWSLIVLLATYPLIIPALAWGCRRIRRRCLPIYACYLVALAVVPFTLIVAGLACYFVSMLMLFVGIPYAVRTPINFATIIVAIYVIAGFLYRYLIGPVNWMLCEQCGYDLTGNTSGVCPECGASLDSGHTLESYQDCP